MTVSKGGRGLKSSSSSPNALIHHFQNCFDILGKNSAIKSIRGPFKRKSVEHFMSIQDGRPGGSVERLNKIGFSLCLHHTNLIP